MLASLLATLAAVALAAAPASAQPTTTHPARSVKFSDGDTLQQKYDLEQLATGAAGCRAGRKGYGYNALTGLWSVVCGWYNWHADDDPTQATASYDVTCTDNGVPHKACAVAGEVLHIGLLHRLGVALQYLAPGGTAILPDGVYVDDGANVLEAGGRAKFPTANQWWLADLYPTAYAAHGPSARVGRLQTLFGQRILAESPGTLTEALDPACNRSGIDATRTCTVPIRRGVHILDARGNTYSRPGPGGYILDGFSENIAPPSHRFVIGGNKWYATCIPTSAKDPTCDLTDTRKELDLSSVWITGAKYTIDRADPDLGLLCLDNAIATAPFDYESESSTCSDAPMIACWDSSGVPAARTSGGCIFDTDDDDVYETNGDDFNGGTCLGGADMVAELIAKGIPVTLFLNVGHGVDGSGSPPEFRTEYGHQGYYAQVRSVSASGSCPGGKNIRTGSSNSNADGFPEQEFPLSATGITGTREAYITTASIVSNVNGGWDGTAIAPAAWLGRIARDVVAAGTTTDSSPASSLNLSSFSQGSPPAVDAWKGYTLILDDDASGGGWCYRTITSNTASSVAWSRGGNCTPAAGDDWRISANSCASGYGSSSQWTYNDDEKACDTETLFGLFPAVGNWNTGLQNATVYYGSTANGNKSQLDGWAGAHHVSYRRLRVHQPLRQLIWDISDFREVSENTVQGGRSLSSPTVFSLFGGRNLISRNSILDWYGLIGFAGQYGQGNVIEKNYYGNAAPSGNPVWAILSGRNTTIRDEHIEGGRFTTAAYVVNPGHGTTGSIGDADVRSLLIENVFMDAGTAPGGIVGIMDDGINDNTYGDANCTAIDTPWDCCTGSGTGTCVDVNCTGAGLPRPCCTGVNTGTCNEVAEQLTVRNVHLRTDDADVCAVWIQEATQTDESLDDYRKTWSIDTVSIDSSAAGTAYGTPTTGNAALCIGTGIPVRPSTSVNLASETQLPAYDNLTVNDAAQAGWPHHAMTAAEAGDCANLPPGTYWIENATASCADTTPADGILDAGSVLNDCKCLSGAWSDI